MKVVTLKMGSIHSVNDNDRAAEPHLVSDSSDRKRKRDEMEEESEISDKIMHTPKKRCLQTTSNYIYNTLFVRGENSDIDILALGKKWNLHKLYLCQSRYFSSMFSGSWKESKQTSVSMEIPDPNITTKALDIAFGSLYQDSIEIIPVEVVSILAAATLLGQDGLIQQCCDIMEETVSVNTVCVFHESAVLYGQMDVKQKCCVWLQNNLMIRHTNFKLLREISIDLMQSVILSPDLLVIQVEMDIYTLLKKWVFLQLHPSWKGSPKTLSVDMGKFYGACYDDNHEYFLDSEQGQAYVQPFKALRLNHIFMDLGSINMIEQDHLIPHDWLVPIYEMQWKQMLKVEQGRDKGPSKPTEFGTNSMRVGRVLQKEGDYCWRWTGFNYGIDLLVSFTNRLIILKRNSLTHTSTTSISMQPKRFFLYRITITGYNATGQIRFKKTSGTVCTKLQKDEEVVVMGISHKIAFPLYFSANFSFCSPLPGVKPQTTQQQNLSADIHDHQPVENQLDAQDDE